MPKYLLTYSQGNQALVTIILLPGLITQDTLYDWGLLAPPIRFRRFRTFSLSCFSYQPNSIIATSSIYKVWKVHNLCLEFLGFSAQLHYSGKLCLYSSEG